VVVAEGGRGEQLRRASDAERTRSDGRETGATVAVVTRSTPERDRPQRHDDAASSLAGGPLAVVVSLSGPSLRH